MSYGNHGSDPTGPYYPYGPPPPFLLADTNKWATWSIVMAFLFAPAGAVFGHWALADSYHRRGRNRAVIGLVLSYTFIVVAVGAVVVWAVVPTYPSLSTTAAGTTTATSVPTPTSTRSPKPEPPTLGVADLPRVLVGLDQVKAIMQLPNLESFDPKGAAGPGGGQGGPPPAETPECASAVINGIDTVYANSGVTGFTAFHFRDASTNTLVDQAAATFDSATAAQRFVAKVTDQWRTCSGRDVTLSAPGLQSMVASIGTVLVTADRVTLQNTITVNKPLPQVRILAVKANVVLDLSAFTKQLTPDQPEAIATQVLANIPG
jgi:hypothetical protein